MPFDPSQPFTLEGQEEGFDPSQPFEFVGEEEGGFVAAAQTIVADGGAL